MIRVSIEKLNTHLTLVNDQLSSLDIFQLKTQQEILTCYDTCTIGILISLNQCKHLKQLVYLCRCCRRRTRQWTPLNCRRSTSD